MSWWWSVYGKQPHDYPRVLVKSQRVIKLSLRPEAACRWQTGCSADPCWSFVRWSYAESYQEFKYSG
jgi:hypothetical protein